MITIRAENNTSGLGRFGHSSNPFKFANFDLDAQISLERWIRTLTQDLGTSIFSNQENSRIFAGAAVKNLLTYRIFMDGSPKKIQVRRTSISTVASLACLTTSPS